jgi:RimJ/RimL family protein N-acetyltransferase
LIKQKESQQTVKNIIIRDVFIKDLATFFKNQKEPEACYMAAFTAKNPSDRNAFDSFWERILGDKSILIKTILFNNMVAGSVLKYEQSGHAEVSYWIGKEFWGKGIATGALSLFLQLFTQRPVYARSAKDNLASIRVLEKCGFIVSGETKGYANARGIEIEELELILK